MIETHDELETQEMPAPEYRTTPLLGIIPDIMRRGAFQTLTKAMLEHGGFVKLKIGPMPAYLVSDPVVLQRVLRDNYRNYRKPTMLYEAVEQLTGKGLVVSEGDFWLRQRRMIQPHMHRKQLAGLTDTKTRAIGTVLDRWSKVATPEMELDLGEAMSHITMDVITQTMFGSDALEADEMQRVSAALTQALDYVSLRGFLSILPNWVPLPGQGDFAGNLQSIRNTIMRLIELRRNDYSERSDLLSMLLSAVDEVTNETMTDEQVFNEAMTVFLAGFETTATALMWLWYVLDSHPKIEARLRAEIDAALGERIPQFEDLPKLPYSMMVFKEVLRLYPPAPLLPREVVAGDLLGEHGVKAGDTLLMFFYGLHRNPRIWDQPEVFEPERFTPENESKRHRFAYLPFSGGPRQCVGDDFAMLEGVLALVMVMQRYRIRMVSDKEVYPKFGATLRPSHPIRGILTALQMASSAH